MIRKEKGITLIALVVTIVVLLILAGVSINLVLGNNGIISKAKDAKKEYGDATDLEIVELAVTSGKLENITKGTEINTAIQDELRKTDSAATVEGAGDYKDITYNGKLYKRNIKSGYTEIEKPFEKPNYNNAMKSLKEGDFVVYNTGTEGVGSVLCRVLYDASSEYGLQIITNDCMKRDGKYELINFGSGNGNIEQTAIDYNDSINILNEQAMKYLNSAYVIDARCVGSNPKEKGSITNKFLVCSSGESVDTGLKDKDDNYEIDYNQLDELGILKSPADLSEDLFDNMTEDLFEELKEGLIESFGEDFNTMDRDLIMHKRYWLASRYNGPYESYNPNTHTSFTIRVSTGLSQDFLYCITEPSKSSSFHLMGGWGDICCFRPVFLLKGDLKITDGDGTENSPYELGV